MISVKKILQIVELKDFEQECKKFRDILLTDPYELEYIDLQRIIKISANFITWSGVIDHAVLKLQSLIWMLEPVYAEITDYNLEICALCINLVLSDESGLQYPALDLLESGWNSTHIRSDTINICLNVLKNKETQPYIKDKMIELESNCNL